uniref:Uncharacterized protein n=1 Tax=Rhizophora mucronata TaxID=61149 RepID=A0A2P2R515_RHIMU
MSNTMPIEPYNDAFSQTAGTYAPCLLQF